MPLSRRPGSPFWHYSFTIDGRRFRGSTGKTGKREAQAVEEERKQAARRGLIPRDRWTLHICLGAYWSDRAKHNRSADTILAKLDALRRHLGSTTPIAALTNAMLMDYRAKRRGERLQAHSINRDFACLKAALHHARVMHGQQVPELAWRQIMAPEPPHRIRFLSREEYARLIAVCDPTLARIVKVAVATGLRRENLLALDWRQVDLSTGRITVHMGKGNKLHTIRMTPECRAALATDTKRIGRVFDRSGFRYRWENAVKSAGLENFRFHDLRHTFASWARMAGADLADICEALGHSSIAVTMRYAHIEPEHHITAFDRISAMVWTPSETRYGFKPLKMKE